MVMLYNKNQQRDCIDFHMDADFVHTSSEKRLFHAFAN